MCPHNWDPYNRWEENRIIHHFQSFEASVISKFAKYSNAYNPGHILTLFNNLAQVQIATSKTILDIYYNKLDTQVAERFKT